MTDIALVNAVESIKKETYDIVNKKTGTITHDYKMKLKAIQDERGRRGHTKSNDVLWSCGDCVLNEINISFLPWIESIYYQQLKASVEPVTQVNLQMIPDTQDEPIKLKTKKK
ncbi:hypothetical protein [Pedobacter sp. L105]|uniref:hypothetical protein n=1 Tax=Pedobacter sp. L105 TaxID=1641871 RepID=UPI00131D3ED2|nr:hypothetical protein [Pedobacter sp. L105]